MTQASPSNEWIPGELRALFPVTGVLHVGVGLGPGLDLYRAWNIPAGVLVDADADRLRRVGAEFAGDGRYLVRQAVFAERNAEAPFFVASNRNESGLVDPASLTGLWPNLTAQDRQQRQTVTMQSWFEADPPRAWRDVINWVVVDCLPALPILRGAGDVIDRWDIIVARVVLDADLAGRSPDLGRTELDRFLAGHDFRVYAEWPELNPGLGHVVYVRNWKSRLGPQLQAKAEERIRQAEMRLEQARADLDHLRGQYAALSDRHAEAQALLREVKANLLDLAAAREIPNAEADPVRPRADGTD